MRKVKIDGTTVIDLKRDNSVFCPIMSPEDACSVCNINCAWFSIKEIQRAVMGQKDESAVACFCGDKLMGELCQ